MPKVFVSLSMILPAERITGVTRYRYGSSSDHSLGLFTIIFCFTVLLSLIFNERGCSLVCPIIFPFLSVIMADTVQAVTDRFWFSTVVSMFISAVFFRTFE